MKKKKLLFAFLLLLSAALGFIAYGALSGMGGSKECIVFVHRNSTPAEVSKQIDSIGNFPQRTAFRILAQLTGYYSNMRPGRYDIGSGTPTVKSLRHLQTGQEQPLKLTVPTLRTVDDLADFLGEHLEMPADSFYKALTDSCLLAAYSLKRETAICLFIPNTYEVYWTVTPRALMKRMKRESDAFWNSQRSSRLQHIAPGFSRNDALTLASIVEQETQFVPERPIVAGMYINRLHRNMPLQADPTVKFALGDFSLRRILHKHLLCDSPYNTYRHAGLPPGPICIPSVSSIDAVLNHAEHNYIYMCAKEDFSGAHNFAADYSTHMLNARKYTEALDHRGIRQ